MRLKNRSIFESNAELLVPSTFTEKEKLDARSNCNSVTVLQCSNVNEMLGLAGIWIGRLPQYLTNAMLDGLEYLIRPTEGPVSCCSDLDLNLFSISSQLYY